MELLPGDEARQIRGGEGGVASSSCPRLPLESPPVPASSSHPCSIQRNTLTVDSGKNAFGPMDGTDDSASEEQSHVISSHVALQSSVSSSCISRDENGEAAALAHLCEQLLGLSSDDDG